MKNYIISLLLLTFVSLNAQENQKYININGTAELILPADQINFSVSIRVIAESVEESKKNNDKYIDELLTILKNTGINSNDIELTPITLGKNYEFTERERKQNGFYTQVSVSFLLKDLSKYFELTNKLSSSNNFEITSSSYIISDYELQHRTAIEKALMAAKEKTEYMAISLGVKLGDVLEIDENNDGRGYPNPFNNIIVENSQGGNISGKVTIVRSVRVKFSLD